MKQIYLIVILSVFLSFCGSQVKKSGQPLKGEWDFKLKKAWEIKQLGSHFVEYILRIRINKENKVFLWDRKQLKVFVCNPEGKLLYEFAGAGEGPGEIMDKYATSPYLTPGFIILHETNNGRVHYYLHDGTFVEMKRIGNLKYSHALKTFIDDDRFLFFLSEDEDAEGKIKSFLGLYNLKTDEFKEIAKLPADKTLTVNDKQAG
ncbi:MAG: hypothetical protein GY765_09795, partial [bacterium]|nr:hypothetical protein [bacterium]